MKPLIGWREWLSLPELGIPALHAKIDTGARTSALHVHDIKLFHRDAKEWVKFKVQPLRRYPNVIINCSAPLLEQRKVMNSGGQVDLRYVIKTKLSLGDMEWRAELTLADRSAMRFRMLLGRNAIRDRCVINPAASHLQGDKPLLVDVYSEFKL